MRPYANSQVVNRTVTRMDTMTNRTDTNGQMVRQYCNYGPSFARLIPISIDDSKHENENQ